ncbi:PAS domain-containing hybrid sensor histidine kinase/response regulator [Clostridium gasigenes]|uniref:PAS domain-containing hybrid sensor histidine kinase/response regulator n=1 Tax=Clostridium gasigenes TaxID=94869 RepID=UPI001C0C47D3|nr:response regulator [Clostridium gasigenes]MBU3107952.1 response regulator [Clostridium gasigenes]
MKNNLFKNSTDASLIEKNPVLMLHVLDTICSGVIISDPNRKGNPITYVNSYFLEITGYKREDIINTDLFNIIFAYSDDITKDSLINLINNNEIINYKILNYKNKINDIYINFNFNPIFDSNNTLLYFICTFEDATKEILLKEQTEKALKTESDFLSNISHEIKTPLNCIIGIVDLLLKIDVDEINKKHLHVLEKNTNHLLNLIENMFNLSELQSGNENLNNSLFNIDQLLNQLVDDYKNKGLNKGLIFNYHYDNRIPHTLIGDSIKLKKIISCLIDTSLNFTEKGQINLIVQLNNMKETNRICVRFTISDTGIGIPKNQLSNIFEYPTNVSNLTSKKYNIKLLNLALSKKLIDLMNGSIYIKSDLNVGTTVDFDCEFELISKNSVDIGNKMKKILLVEDSEDNRFLINCYLKKTNYILDYAENGEIAYEKFKNNTYNLILMDIQMPVMDGYKATTLIRGYEEKNNLSKTTIIALTAYSFKENLEKAIEAGCNFTLMKPIKKTTLLETLNDILGI